MCVSGQCTFRSPLCKWLIDLRHGLIEGLEGVELAAQRSHTPLHSLHREWIYLSVSWSKNVNKRLTLAETSGWLCRRGPGTA